MTLEHASFTLHLLPVSSFAEKSDLVDTILMCRGVPSQPDTESGQAPPLSFAQPPAAPATAPAAAAADSRRPFRDSSRVGPYESIRVRAMEEPEETPKPADGARGDSAAAGGDEDEDGFVVVDVETVDDGADGGEEARPSEPDTAPTEVQGRPVTEDVDAAVDVDVDVQEAVEVEVESPAAAPGGGEVGEEEVVVVDDDPGEPQSESVAIDVEEEEESSAGDPVSGADLVSGGGGATVEPLTPVACRVSSLITVFERISSDCTVYLY